MNESTQENLNIPAWISVKEASSLLNLKEKTVKDYCRNGKVNYKIEVKGGQHIYSIKFDSLPEYAQNKAVSAFNF